MASVLAVSRARYFYPRSPCGERPAIDVFLAVWAVISIHALLAESDLTISIVLSMPPIFLSTLSLRRATKIVGHIDLHSHISIHALLAESDYAHFGWDAGADLFLSTLSLRRATLPVRSACYVLAHFYPRSPCGERLFHDDMLRYRDAISIHALLAESDMASCPSP